MTLSNWATYARNVSVAERFTIAFHGSTFIIHMQVLHILTRCVYSFGGFYAIVECRRRWRARRTRLFAAACQRCEGRKLSTRAVSAVCLPACCCCVYVDCMCYSLEWCGRGVEVCVICPRLKWLHAYATACRSKELSKTCECNLQIV